MTKGFMYMKTFAGMMAVLILVAGACKKDKAVLPPPPARVPDTIWPRPYLPVYPGSYWLYLDEKGDTVRHFTSPAFTRHCVQANYYDTAVVPVLNRTSSYSVAIYGYDEAVEDRPFVTGNPSFFLRPLLSERVTAVYLRKGSDYRYGDFRETATTKAKYLNGPDTVLVVTGHNNKIPYRFEEHYTRNIGLTWCCTIDTVSGDTTARLSLVGFFIGKK